jgi:hypothetical protein
VFLSDAGIKPAPKHCVTTKKDDESRSLGISV